MSDAHMLLAGWRRWGEDLPTHLVGDYALAIADHERRMLFLARDPLGVKPLYYMRQGGSFLFATSLAELRRRADHALVPDESWIARYLLQMSADATTTSYREVFKLPPGTRLSVQADGTQQLSQFHRWQAESTDARRRNPVWVQAYREVLEESIRCRMDADAPMGTENSGGLDSASVTAYLAHLLGEPGDRLQSLGFARCEHEPAVIQAIDRACGITREHLFTDTLITDSLASRIEMGLRVLGYPEEHGNATGHLPFYQRCREEGIRTLFSGFGGDEVATNPGHLYKLECLDRHRYRALWEVLPGRWPMRSMRLAKAAIIGRRNPPYNPQYLAAWKARWSSLLLRPEVAARMTLYPRYLEGARHDAPYRRINDYIVHGLLKKPYIVARLENCSLMAAHFGVDYRWPFWDVRLVQQYLSTPSIEKFGPSGMGRYLHRRAVAGIVPAEVAWKPTKSMGEGPLRRLLQGEGLRDLGRQGRSLEADLCPELDELVDRDRFRQQIKRALEGGDDWQFALNFRRNVVALSWLDAWLKGVGQD